MNGSFLPYPQDSDTVHLRQDHWCSSQSRAVNTVAMQNGGTLGLHTTQELVTEFLKVGRLQCDKDSDI
jgi:hypothetical protein